MRRLTKPMVLALAWIGTAALAQDAAPGRIRGVITTVAGSNLVVATADGTKIHVHLSPSAQIIAATKASLFDVTPGTFVGIANTGPNGLQDALEVHIIAKSLNEVKKVGMDTIGMDEGQERWDLDGHSRMTNGTAGVRTESYDGQNVTLTYKGGESTIQVRPNTPIVRLRPGTAADLKPGATIFIREATPQSDGSVTTPNMIVGRDGTKLAL